MDQIELIQLLIERWKYPSGQASETARKLLNLSDELQQSFTDWLNTGTLPEMPIYAGYTPVSLFQEYILKPPACFLMLDWLRRNPTEAMTALLREIPRRKTRLLGGNS